MKEGIDKAKCQHYFVDVDKATKKCIICGAESITLEVQDATSKTAAEEPGGK